MELDITLKNYRCFVDESPAMFTLRPGLTSFVGPNNAGKSAVLRFLYEFRNLFTQLADADTLVAALTENPPRLRGMSSDVADTSQLFTFSNDRDLTVEMQPRDWPDIDDAVAPEMLTVTFVRGAPNWTVVGTRADGNAIARDHTWARDGTRIIKDVKVEFGPLLEFLRHAANSMYVPAFRNVINVGGSTSYFDISTGEAFVRDWHNYKAGTTRASNVAAWNLMRDVQSIFGFQDFDINPTPDGTSLQLFIDGRSFGLNEVGAGLAHFILTLTNVAVKRPSFLLIDEPELNLHPSLQLDFLTSVASYAGVGCVFSTHSIGLARSASEQVFSVYRNGGEGSRIAPFEATRNLTEFLGELNYSGYRDLGYTRILLVEGNTEVTAVMQLLRLYNKEHQVVLLSLGGADGIRSDADVELEELMRISPNVFALIDSERDATTAQLDRTREAFRAQCESRGIRCHVLERRAFENYLPDHAIKAHLGPKHSALEPYETLKSKGVLAWSKRDNWRIARLMRKSDLGGTDLGEFLEEL